MNFLPRSLRFATRMLRKSTLSTAAAVVAMALGIGLTAGMFSILDGIFLRGLHYNQAHELLHLERNHLEEDIQSMEVTLHDFEDWRAQQTSFEGLAGITGGTVNLADKFSEVGVPERYDGSFISANFLDLLEIRPVVGQGFEPADEVNGAPAVVLLGYHVWQQRYRGDPSVVGRHIRANSEPATIVGVLPEGERFPVNSDVWMPLQSDTGSLQRGEGVTLEVFGRLKDGVTFDQANEEMTIIAARLAQEYPETNEGISSVIQPYLHEFIGEETRSMLWLMFAAVVLVFLIACFNVANLLIGRASLRGQELAIRTALGSSRRQVVGLIFTEALIISVAGAALGSFLAYFGVKLFAASIADTDPPFWFDLYLSPKALMVAALAAATAAIIAGLYPALKASSPNISAVLQDSTRGSTSFRLSFVSKALVVVTVVLSAGLAIAAGLSVRSVIAANSYDLGFDNEQIISARIGLFEGDYPTAEDQIRFFEQVQERVAARPDVISAAIGTVLPAETEIGSGRTRFELPGQAYESERDVPRTRLTTITPGYFETLGASIIGGRDFSTIDRAGGSPVVIVNEDFARRTWPGEDPLGQRLRLYAKDAADWLGLEVEGEPEPAPWMEVIGVAPNVRFADFDNDDDQDGIYVPLAQNGRRFAFVLAHTRGDAAALAQPLRREVLALDPDLPLYFVRTMDQIVDRALFFPSLFGVLFGLFAAVAMVLACVGLYGVMAFAVTQRTQEMGVRMAFGARGTDVLRLVLRQGLTQVVIGLVLGIGLGMLLGMGLKTFLFQIQAYDPLTLILVPLILFIVALLACLGPGRRASRVHPMVALRYE